MLGSNKWLLCVFMFIGGMAEVGRYYVGYVYAVEVLPKNLSHNGGLTIFIGMAITKIGICLFFWTASKEMRNWHYLMYVSLVYISFSMFMTIYYLKESARWMYDKGMARESLEILRYI
jgi:MFS family permease